MIEKKTTVDQIEVRDDGSVQIRFGLLLVEDGAEIDRKWHRTAINSDTDIGEQMQAVNAHLSEMGKGTVDAAGIAKIAAFVDLARAHS